MGSEIISDCEDDRRIESEGVRLKEMDSLCRRLAAAEKVVQVARKAEFTVVMKGEKALADEYVDAISAYDKAVRGVTAGGEEKGP